MADDRCGDLWGFDDLVPFMCELPAGHEPPHLDRSEEGSEKAWEIRWADEPWQVVRGSGSP